MSRTDPEPDVTTPTSPPSTRTRVRTLAVAIVGLSVVLAGMLFAFGLPAVNGGPHNAPIGVVGPAPAVDALRAQTDARAPDAWDVIAYADENALTHAIEHRDAIGGFIIGADTVTIYTASAAGGQTAAAVTALGTALADGSRAGPVARDLVPFPDDDPRGAGLGAAALPLIIGGVLPAIALIRLFPGHANLRLRVVGAVVFALVAGATTTAVLHLGLGTVDDHLVLTALGLSLGMAALALTFLGLESLLGFAGLGAGIALMMFVGNPLSGLSTGPYWLPDGWRTLGQLLPPGASGSLLRANAFFDGIDAAGPIIVLTCWSLVGLVLTFVADRRGRADTAPAT